MFGDRSNFIVVHQLQPAQPLRLRGGVSVANWHEPCEQASGGRGAVAIMEPLNQIPESEAFEPRLGRSVSIEQAAQLLGVSRRTVYNRIRDGKLQTIRTLGGSQRVLLTSLDEMRRLTTMGHAGAPALSRVEGPALSRVEGPPLSRVESIVAGHPVPPIDSDRQVS